MTRKYINLVIYFNLLVLLTSIIVMSSCTAREPSKSVSEHIADAKAVYLGVVVTIGDMVQLGVLKPDEAQKLFDEAKTLNSRLSEALSLVNVGKELEGKKLYESTYVLLVKLRQHLHERLKQ